MSSPAPGISTVIWSSGATLTSGADGGGSQAQVHGHLGGHGQQVVLEGLLHQALLLLRQPGHLPLGPLPPAGLQLLPELLQRGGAGQAGHLLLTQGQRQGGPRRQERGSQVI